MTHVSPAGGASVPRAAYAGRVLTRADVATALRLPEAAVPEAFAGSPGITAVTHDSRAVEPGAAFVAVSGFKSDGLRFAASALAGGASLVVAEREWPTAADREASRLIVQGLHAAFPADGLLSEEETDAPERLGRERVWIVDPIDGTKEYVSGSPDYCVSIGLSVAGQPVLGVVYVPATDELLLGRSVGCGAAQLRPPSRLSVRKTRSA